MNKEIIESVVNNIVTELDNNIKTLNDIVNVLTEARETIHNMLSGTEELKLVVTPTKERSVTRQGISAAKQTMKFLNKYMRSGEPFTHDILFARVQGLVPTATKNAMDNAIYRFKKENNVYFESIEIKGIKQLVIASNDQKE
jgi:hypothetical protein